MNGRHGSAKEVCALIAGLIHMSGEKMMCWKSGEIKDKKYHCQQSSDMSRCQSRIQETGRLNENRKDGLKSRLA
jgi:hypothetical protein